MHGPYASQVRIGAFRCWRSPGRSILCSGFRTSSPQRDWTSGTLNATVISAMPLTIEIYPDFEEQVRDLVQQHRKSHKQLLRLAVYFAPPRRAKRDIFLFEVIDG